MVSGFSLFDPSCGEWCLALVYSWWYYYYKIHYWWWSYWYIYHIFYYTIYCNYITMYNKIYGKCLVQPGVVPVLKWTSRGHRSSSRLKSCCGSYMVVYYRMKVINTFRLVLDQLRVEWSKESVCFVCNFDVLICSLRAHWHL